MTSGRLSCSGCSTSWVSDPTLEAAEAMERSIGFRCCECFSIKVYGKGKGKSLTAKEPGTPKEPGAAKEPGTARKSWQRAPLPAPWVGASVSAIMDLPSPLHRGRLLRRYKRFLAEVRLDDGQKVTAHCADPGSVLAHL